jgi:hypothetical protein
VEWLVGWAYWSVFTGWPGPWDWSPDRAVPGASAAAVPDPEITDTDLWLIEVTYETVAAQSRCVRCGAPLGRGLHVVASLETSPWTVSIVTRCGGWWHHRHVATARSVRHGLVLGDFRVG